MRHVLAVVSACALASSPNSFAGEGGVQFWFSGQYARLAAVPATPGWSLPMPGYNYSGDAAGRKSFSRGDSGSGARLAAPCPR
ncbi:hypothetical protein [Candidatus Accumulibacter sp. ACC003]|uniref:hypothetical protein n=1 Tax=Candidatus Accumulibacter sp. ACC003 TaxID=2823334 RepID=UPI0025B9FE1D|nr:hypothetical protein [Candidatus Accumulibacter sp. ACC003]